MLGYILSLDIESRSGSRNLVPLLCFLLAFEVLAMSVWGHIVCSLTALRGMFFFVVEVRFLRKQQMFVDSQTGTRIHENIPRGIGFSGVLVLCRLVQ